VSPFIDHEGRIAGRVNLVDALCILVLLGLIPVAYSTWLLFHPAAPRIDSVERSEVTSAEEKVAAGQPIRLKVKVRGDHLTPMLRAYVGNIPALGFTFETPKSGDVIIGENVPPGIHDLVLFDGPTVVARAPGAVTIGPSAGALVRVIGAFTLLDPASAKRLQVGQTFQLEGRPPAEIIALGEVMPDRRALKSAAGTVETASPESWGRDAILRMQCDPHPDVANCHISGTTIPQAAPVVIVVPGSAPPHRLRVQAVVPDQTPTPARLRMRVDGNSQLVKNIRAGDRDVRTPAIDDRAAVVESVREAGEAAEMVLRLGLDRASDGWRYHAHSIVPGGPFILITDRYGIRGTVIDITVNGQ
jgi:hypothetical protein